MSITVGGWLIKRLEMTHSWGVTPGSASIEAVGGVSMIQPDSDVLFSIGGFVFQGIVTNAIEKKTENGLVISVSASDQRIKLQDDSVYCFFNGVEILEDDPDTPGIDRKKQYWHIYPEDWKTQKRTYTKQAKTAREICQAILAADTLSIGWAATYTPEFNTKLLAIDANSGRKLGTVLQEICDQIGVQMTLAGPYLLAFSVKGTGVTPGVTPSCNDISEGLARGSNPTHVRMVGDRVLAQELGLELEADWSDHFEEFWFKPAWVARVIDVFGLPSDPADRAEAEATAREVTLRQYIDETGRTDVADYGVWGEVSRMEIPVWIYIDDIVFKAYRVPDDFRVRGLDMDSVELRDGLLCAVDSDTHGVLSYKSEEQYPDAKALCIAQGQPLSLYDPKTREAITPEMFASARTQWRQINRFNIDTKNKVVIFEEPVFVDAAGDGALFIQPNKGIAGLGDAMESLVVPNAAAVISAARVKASLCFECDRFYKEYGSGARHEARYIRGLGYHLLLNNGALVRELLYTDERGADSIAGEIADGILTGQDQIPSGGFTRHGAAGTYLSGMTDRVTVTLYFESGGEGEGLSEHIEYAKERSPIHYETGRELDRRQASRELFPGQKQLEEEAKQTRLLGDLQKEKKRQSERDYENLDGVTTRLPGNRDCSPTYCYSKGDRDLPVGLPVFVDDSNTVDLTSTRFAGVITTSNVSTDAHAKIPIATQGLVTLRVQGPFATGENVGCNDLDDSASTGGWKPVGIIQSPGYTGTAVVLAVVRIGIAPWRKRHPWEIVAVRVAGQMKVSVFPGSISSIVPENIFSSWPIGPSTTYYVKLHGFTDGRSVNRARIEVDTTPPPRVATSTPQTAPPELWDIIGIVVTNAADDHGFYCGSVYPIRQDNLDATPLVNFVESQEPQTIGGEPFMRWWSWRLVTQTTFD